MPLPIEVAKAIIKEARAAFGAVILVDLPTATHESVKKETLKAVGRIICLEPGEESTIINTIETAFNNVAGLAGALAVAATYVMIVFDKADLEEVDGAVILKGHVIRHPVHIKFIRDLHAAGFELTYYQGRDLGFYYRDVEIGELGHYYGPAVSHGSSSVGEHTTVPTMWDQLGKGYIVHPQTSCRAEFLGFDEEDTEEAI